LKKVSRLGGKGSKKGGLRRTKRKNKKKNKKKKNKEKTNHRLKKEEPGFAGDFGTVLRNKKDNGNLKVPLRKRLLKVGGRDASVFGSCLLGMRLKKEGHYEKNSFKGKHTHMLHTKKS